MYIIKNIHLEWLICFLEHVMRFFLESCSMKSVWWQQFFPVWYCSSMASQCPQSHSHKEDFSPWTKSYKSSCLVHLFSTLGTSEPTTSSLKRKEIIWDHLIPHHDPEGGRRAPHLFLLTSLPASRLWNTMVYRATSAGGRTISIFCIWTLHEAADVYESLSS